MKSESSQPLHRQQHNWHVPKSRNTARKSLAFCCKITRTTLPVNSIMHTDNVFFPVKHHSQISFKLPVNSVTSLTRPLSGCASLWCVCEHQCFCWCFHFCVKRSHSCSLFWARDITLDDFICIWMLWLDFLRPRILNSYMFIPVIFILRLHTAELWQFD